MARKEKLPNPLTLRKRLGLTQSEFWGPIGVTQSGGSRYEGGRFIPKPVQHMLALAYGKTPIATLAAIRREGIAELRISE